jgi:hypothetical protein
MVDKSIIWEKQALELYNELKTKDLNNLILKGEPSSVQIFIDGFKNKYFDTLMIYTSMGPNKISDIPIYSTLLFKNDKAIYKLGEYKWNFKTCTSIDEIFILINILNTIK